MPHFVSANQFQGRKGGATLEIYFVAPASGSVRSVNVARGLNSATSPGASYGIQDSDIFTFFLYVNKIETAEGTSPTMH